MDSSGTLFICLSQAVITLPSMKQEECNTISHYLSLWSIKTVCRFPDELFAPWAGSNFFLAWEKIFGALCSNSIVSFWQCKGTKNSWLFLIVYLQLSVKICKRIVERLKRLKRLFNFSENVQNRSGANIKASRTLLL